MKHASKRTFAVLLSAVMTAGAIAGCGKGSGKPDPADSGSNNTGDVGFHATGLPITDDVYELDVLTTRWGSMGDSFTDNQFLKDLEAESNIKVNWQVQSINDWEEQRSILMASGNLPSVLFGYQTMKDVEVINNLDYFLALDDLIGEYMPNYSAALQELPALRQLTTYPDGKIYSLGKNLPKRPVASDQLMINKTWLDNLGLEIPTTLEDLTAVLRAFKEQDANGNGDPNDEIPFTGGVSNGKGDINGQYLSPFGVVEFNGKLLMMKDETPTFFPTMDGYKEALKWLQQMYAEGIMDPEAFTQDDTMLNAKYQDPDASRVGMVYAWTPDALFNNWKNEYVAIEPVAGPDGKRYANGDPDGVYSVTRNEIFITKFCKHPEIAARWADQFYTGEASIQNFWGAIGTVIQKNEDGTYELLDPPEGTSADAWYWEQSTRDFGPKYVSKEFEDKISLSPESGDGLKVELAKMAEPYVVAPFPDVLYDEQESSEISMLETDIKEYVATTRVQWISSSTDIDAQWDSYVAQLEQMGLSRLMEINQTAYNRYIAFQ